MLFKPCHIPMIRSGSKTVTRREWKRRQVVPGNVYIASTEMFTSDEEADCYIRVTDLYEQPLGEMTDEDARAEGDYEDLEEFKEGYERVYGEGAWDPEKVVWVVEFEYVGRARPVEQQTLVTDGGTARGERWPPDMSSFDHAIVEDDGTSVIQAEMRRFGCDDAIRLNESQVEALQEWDRAVVRTWQGRKIIVEIFPDGDENAPVEIRPVEDEEEVLEDV